MKEQENEWGIVDQEVQTEKKVVTIEELDQAVRNVADARKLYDDRKKMSDEASRQVDLAEESLVNLMIEAGKSSYKLDGVGNVSVFDKFAIQNPTDPDEKQKFWAWVEAQYGQDGLNKYQVTNYQAINSLYNEWQEKCAAMGGDPTIPGLGLPTAKKQLRLTKAK